MATPKRRGPKRKRGPRVLTIFAAPVAALNESARYVVVRDILKAARDLERRERELPTIADPDDAAHARAAIDALRRALPPFPIASVADAARGAELWFAKRGHAVPAERARLDYFRRRAAWRKQQGATSARKVSDAASALAQALARISANRNARK